MEEDFVRYLKSFEYFFRSAAHAPHNGRLERLILEHNSDFSRHASHAASLLKQFNYRDFVHNAEHTLALLHQDYIYHNLIWINGEIHLIDFDYMTFDLRCIDIAKFLRRNLRQSNWEMRVADNIISGYTSVTPLCQEEFHLIYILLYLPYKYWQTLYFFFSDQKNRHYKRTYETIKQLVSQKRDKNIFMQNFEQKYLK